VGDLITIYEQSFNADDAPYHEINYIFSTKLHHDDLDVVSNEKHLAYEWIDLNDISNINLVPNIFKKIINDYSAGKTINNFYSDM